MSEHFNTLVENNLAGNEANVIMAAYGELNCVLMSTNVFTGLVSVSQSHLVSTLYYLQTCLEDVSQSQSQSLGRSHLVSILHYYKHV